MSTYDVVIVGGGSAGAVLAARLSETEGRSVLLLEAGPAWERVEDIPQELLEPGKVTASMPGHPNNWALISEEMPGLKVSMPRGKGLGGSSLINGTYFIRGTRSDFDHWTARGNDLWSYDQVLPYFRKLENDLDFSGPDHGTGGPITVRREGIDRAPEFTAAFTSGCTSLGFPEEPDKNAGGVGGVGPIPANIDSGRRMSTALGYVLPNLHRPNLTVIGDAYVERVLFKGIRAVGVEATVGNERKRFTAGEVVLSVGALRSPQLLMLSGVGPAEHLRDLGIEVLHDLPGVGQGLSDHPEIAIAYKSDAPIRKFADRAVMTSALHWSADASGSPGDVEIMPFVAKMNDTVSTADTFRRPIAGFKAMRGISWGPFMRLMRLSNYAATLVSLQQQDSRGSVTLASRDPYATPLIAKNLLSDARDMKRFREAVRTAVNVFESGPMREIGAELVRGPDLGAGDAALDDYIRASFFTAGHPSSSCRMGSGSDPGAVVDQEGRVHGVENLRVIDGSIFPRVVSRGPNATTIMLAERIADLIKQEDSTTSRHGEPQSEPIAAMERNDA